MQTIPVHVSTIAAGDTVLHEGRIRTVCKGNLGKADLLGRTLFGDSYQAGNKPVQKVIIKREIL